RLAALKGWPEAGPFADGCSPPGALEPLAYRGGSADRMALAGRRTGTVLRIQRRSALLAELRCDVLGQAAHLAMRGGDLLAGDAQRFIQYSTASCSDRSSRPVSIKPRLSLRPAIPVLRWSRRLFAQSGLGCAGRHGRGLAAIGLVGAGRFRLGRNRRLFQAQTAFDGALGFIAGFIGSDVKPLRLVWDWAFMTFEEAIEEVLLGRAVSRAAWQDADLLVSLANPSLPGILEAMSEAGAKVHTP